MILHFFAKCKIFFALFSRLPPHHHYFHHYIIITYFFPPPPIRTALARSPFSFPLVLPPAVGPVAYPREAVTMHQNINRFACNILLSQTSATMEALRFRFLSFVEFSFFARRARKRHTDRPRVAFSPG
jgi:hypothetical protein